MRPCLGLAALLATGAALSVTGAFAQAPASGGYRPVKGPHTLNPGEWPAHYPLADETEAAVAAPEVHHVRYIDAHVRLVEVAYFPGVVGNMHGHPFASVFAVDAPTPRSTNTTSDPTRNMQAAVSLPLAGTTYPICRAASPQMPHHESNLDSFPHHFLRLEFLRVDGADLATHWQDWYRYTPRSADGARLLFEDDHVRLVEVFVRPGETRRVPRSVGPSVIAFDAGAPAGLPDGSRTSAALATFSTLGCAVTAPAGPVVTRATGTVPIHYYRIEFKRVDGDGLRDHWREWYPWLADLKAAYDQSPTVPNF